mgnify:CR=1 FL=1
MKPLEKIIIASSVPLNTPKTAYDPMLRKYYSDYATTTGYLAFIGNKEKLNRFKEFMKKRNAWEMIDELYIYDRYHKNGNDMVESVKELRHEFNCRIEIKKEYKHCWFNEEVYGCKLWPEYALDPNNKRF